MRIQRTINLVTNATLNKSEFSNSRDVKSRECDRLTPAACGTTACPLVAGAIELTGACASKFLTAGARGKTEIYKDISGA